MSNYTLLTIKASRRVEGLVREAMNPDDLKKIRFIRSYSCWEWWKACLTQKMKTKIYPLCP
jgi:hypothetical protein